MAAARYKMISIPEAQATVLQHTPVLESETVPLGSALGRVLAKTVTARDNLPPFPASIMVRSRNSTAAVSAAVATQAVHVMPLPTNFFAYLSSSTAADTTTRYCQFDPVHYCMYCTPYISSSLQTLLNIMPCCHACRTDMQWCHLTALGSIP
jgi:hypothetical protein